jgi:EF-P beta-lysylation protein EpmB
VAQAHCIETDAPDERDWRQALRSAVRDVAELASLLHLSPDALGAFQPGRREFPLLVPRSFIRRMRSGDPNDPLLRQVLPRLDERTPTPGFAPDPLGESLLAHEGFIQKYPNRALLITTEACPLHCRYCFRREFPYRAQNASRENWRGALTRAETAAVGEIILSGGDPLSLSNARLSELLRALERMTSVERVRIHTRFPIVIPERVDDGLLRLLEGSKLQRVIVVHCNHPNEIDGGVRDAMRALRGTGNLLLNQSVLLRRINDAVSTLADLSEALLRCDVLPYYLHLLDPIAGAAHFEVQEARARALVEELRERAPGYLVPRLVREIPGRPGKTLVA